MKTRLRCYNVQFLLKLTQGAAILDFKLGVLKFLRPSDVQHQGGFLMMFPTGISESDFQDRVECTIPSVEPVKLFELICIMGNVVSYLSRIFIMSGA